jgi:hypothetical protein
MFADLSYLNEIVLLKFANQFFAVAIINKWLIICRPISYSVGIHTDDDSCKHSYILMISCLFKSACFKSFAEFLELLIVRFVKILSSFISGFCFWISGWFFSYLILFTLGSFPIRFFSH